MTKLNHNVYNCIITNNNDTPRQKVVCISHNEKVDAQPTKYDDTMSNFGP